VLIPLDSQLAAVSKRETKASFRTASPKSNYTNGSTA
jgi:hypothetical protein